MTPPATNYAEWKFWVDIMVLVVVAGNTIYTWWSNREKVTSKRFASLEKEVLERLKKADLDEDRSKRDLLCREHKGKTDALTKAYEHLHIEVSRLPDRREITNLDNSIKDLTRELGTLEGRISGINRVADLMNEFLINQGGKK